MELGIGQQIGNFRIVAQIGSGGMGAVFRAEHVLIGSPAAIKVLRPGFCENPDMVTRFFNEARAASSINHPGIISIFDFGFFEERTAYIIMEFLAGQTLTERIQEHGALGVDAALGIAGQIASALAAAHGKNIIHRDLKPDNVILVRDPDIGGGERIKLLDFGVAKLVDPSGDGLRTQTGLVVGTPAYMAPEQCSGSRQVDGRADLYSLGCILYRMLCGQPPFTMRSIGELVAAQINTPPAPLCTVDARIPASVDELVMRLLAKNPDERFPSAQEVLFVMRDLVSEGSPLKAMREVSTTAKTLPFARTHMPLLAGPELIEDDVELIEDEDEDDGGEDTVVERGIPLALPGVATLQPSPHQDAPPPAAPRPAAPRQAAPPELAVPPALGVAMRPSQPAVPVMRPSQPAVPVMRPSQPAVPVMRPSQPLGPELGTISRAGVAIPWSAGEEPRSRARLLVSGAVAAGILAISAVIFFLIGDDSPSPSALTPPAPTTADKPPAAAVDEPHAAPTGPAPTLVPSADAGRALVSIRIDSRPSGAAVIRASDGEKLGTTPYQTRVARDPGADLVYELRKPGYEDHQVQLSLDDDHDTTIALELSQGVKQPPRKRVPARRKPRRGPGNPYE